MDRKIQIAIAPGRFPDSQYQDYYEKMYQCWHQVWSQTFLENDKNPVLHADAFTRQDLTAGIFVDDICRAVSLHRYTNRSAIQLQKDSYFANWSELHLQKLLSNGPNILVSSYFTIHPTGRGQSLGFSMKDYLLALTTAVFLDSNCDAMTGAARKNRKVHDVTYAWGATPVGIDIPSGHNDLVDLVAFFRPQVEETRKKNPIIKQFDQLWENKVVILQSFPQNLNSFQDPKVLRKPTG